MLLVDADPQGDLTTRLGWKDNDSLPTMAVKAAMQIRNREMVDRADLVLCCIERKSGGAYQTVLYAKKQNKQIINLAGGMTTFCA